MPSEIDPKAGVIEPKTGGNTSGTIWFEPGTSFGDNPITGNIRVVGNKADACEQLLADMKLAREYQDRLVHVALVNPPTILSGIGGAYVGDEGEESNGEPVNAFDEFMDAATEAARGACSGYRAFISTLTGVPEEYVDRWRALEDATAQIPPHAAVEPLRSLVADKAWREDLPETAAALEALLALYDRIAAVPR